MLPHESAKYHVTGEAVYIDDIPTNDQFFYNNECPTGKIKRKIQYISINKAYTVGVKLL
jgi:xanthine dehydrogenase molybdopterin-binding subunit B